MDSNLCLTYNFNNGGLTVKTCQDAPGFPEAQQGWDFFDGRLHPESDVCLKSKSNEYVGNYDSLVMVKGGALVPIFKLLPMERSTPHIAMGPECMLESPALVILQI